MARKRIPKKKHNNRNTNYHKSEQKRLDYIADLALGEIQPKTDNQEKIFDLYDEDRHLLLHGLPGTGKTFISLYLALNDLLDERFEKIIILRSAVATREIGHLPGNGRQKMAVYEAPYEEIFGKLFDDKTVYNQMKQRGLVEFHPTSFLRGVTFENALIIVDEVQNLNDHEVNSVITRLGDDSRIIMCGDFRQNDFVTRGVEESGIEKLFKTIDLMPSFAHVELQVQDIVRSGIVKEYIEARLKLGFI